MRIENRELRIADAPVGCVLAALFSILYPLSSILHAASPATDPAQLSQDILLEAARQEVVGQRLTQAATDFASLIAELKANGSIQPRAEDEINQLMARLKAAQETHVAQTASILRAAAGDPARARAGLAAAEREVDGLVRELGSLLLRAGTSHAMEVAIDQVQDIIARQEALQQETVGWAYSPTTSTTTPAVGEYAHPTQLAAAQTALAEQTAKLVAEVGGMENDSTGDSLVAVRLARAIRLLADQKVVQTMNAAATDLAQKQPAPAVVKQAAALKVLRDAWYKLEIGAEYKALVAARDQLKKAHDAQKAMRRQIEMMDAAGFGSQAADLAQGEMDLSRQIGRVIAPVPIEAPIAAAVAAMADARTNITAKDQPKTTAAQVKAEEALAEAIKIVEERLAELRKFDEVQKQLAAAMERARLIQEFIDRQQQILDETESLGAKTKSVTHLSAAQGRLAAEVKQLDGTLPEASKWTPMVHRSLTAALAAMTAAGAKLGGNEASAATPPQSKALRALEEAKELVIQEIAALERQARLLRLISDMRQLAKYLKDVEDEQRDLRERTESPAAATQPARPLATGQQQLATAVSEVNELVGAMEGAAELQEPLTKTEEAMTGAAGKLNQNQLPPAVPLQKQAEALLREAQKMALQIAEQADLLQEWMALAEKLQADMSGLLQRQIALRKETEVAKVESLPELGGEQDILRAEADVFARMFEHGQEEYQTATNEMAAAVKSLKASTRKDAVQHQVLAEEALGRAQKQLAKALEQLELVPGMIKPPESTELGPIAKAMDLAARQRELRLKTRATEDKGIAVHAPPQQGLHDDAEAIKGQITDGAELIEEAATEMSKAVTELKKLGKPAAIEHQQLAEKALRQFSLEQALKSFKLPEKVAPGIAIPGGTIAVEAPAIHVFAKTGVGGEPPPRTRSSWEPLGKRERAALKENFARELPVEYRELLRDYYEALSK